MLLIFAEHDGKTKNQKRTYSGKSVGITLFCKLSHNILRLPRVAKWSRKCQ